MVLRWKLTDPADSNEETASWTFPWNPNRMTSPFPARTISVEGTTAIDGQVLLWEGMTLPTSWTFGGAIKDAAHYEALRHWVYERQGRLYLDDHFGRRLVVLLREFRPEQQKARIGRYWHHTYTVEATVLSVGPPSMNDLGQPTETP